MLWGEKPYHTLLYWLQGKPRAKVLSPQKTQSRLLGQRIDPLSSKEKNQNRRDTARKQPFLLTTILYLPLSFADSPRGADPPLSLSLSRRDAKGKKAIIE